MAQPSTNPNNIIDKINVGSKEYKIALPQENVNTDVLSVTNGKLDIKKDTSLTVNNEGLGVQLAQNSGLAKEETGLAVNVDGKYLIREAATAKITLNVSNFATINSQSIVDGGNIDLSIDGSVSELQGQIDNLQGQIDTLVSGNTKETIDNFTEIIDFLENVEETQKLVDILNTKADSATTLSGYGITDAKIEGETITLGDKTITPLITIPSNYATKEDIEVKLTTYVHSITINNQTISKQEIPYFTGLTSSITVSDIGTFTSDLSGNMTISGVASQDSVPTEEKINEWGFTKNEGTVTGIKMNGTVIGNSGVVDLGGVYKSVSDITIGTGLHNTEGKLYVNIGKQGEENLNVGLKLDEENRISINVNENSGLKLQNNQLALSYDETTGLAVNNKQQLTLRFGKGIGIDENNNICYTGTTVSGTTLFM